MRLVDVKLLTVSHLADLTALAIIQCIRSIDYFFWDFPGGAVVKNPPANAGDTGSSPGPGRSHMPWSS